MKATGVLLKIRHRLIYMLVFANSCGTMIWAQQEHEQTKQMATEVSQLDSVPTPLVPSFTTPLLDAPDLQQAGGNAVQVEGQTERHDDGQTKRILGIIPNFKSVSAHTTLPPQSLHDKFVAATQDSFDYSSVALPAILSGINLARNSTPEFGKGGVGYGRYFWHTALDQTVENYMVEFIVPALTREDTRYYTLGEGGFRKRSWYAITRTVVTRSDTGKPTFNASEIIGAGAAAGVSSTYYPIRERSIGNTGSQWGLNVGIDAAGFVLREFWPEIDHALFHGKKPFHIHGT